MTTSSSCCSLATAVRPGAAYVRALFGGRRRRGAMVERPRRSRDRGLPCRGAQAWGRAACCCASARTRSHPASSPLSGARGGAALVVRCGAPCSPAAGRDAARGRCAASTSNKEDPAGEQVGEAADLGHGRAGALPHHHQRCAPCRAATHQAAERHVADWEARAAYYRGAMGILLVYDVTDDASFTNIRNWMRNIEQHASDSVNKARPARRTSAARVACARALPAGPRTEPLPRPASEGSLRRTLAAPCRRSAHTRPGASRLPASALRRRGRGRCWWATSAIWTRVSARCPTARARRWPTSSASSSLRPAPKAT